MSHQFASAISHFGRFSWDSSELSPENRFYHEIKSIEKCVSRHSGECLLCGRSKASGMVKEINYVKSKYGKLIWIKRELNYKTYAAQCNEFYVGQTITFFSQRWCSHGYTWKIMSTRLCTSGVTTIKFHYINKHPITNFEKNYIYVRR